MVVARNLPENKADSEPPNRARKTSITLAGADDVCAGPRFIRSTMYTIPDNPDIKKQTGVPFGLVLCPMAEVLPGEYPPPIVNLGELGKKSGQLSVW